jgi:hypothetical protein
VPQAANIVLADAQGTPVNHTFIPKGRDANGVFWFEDQSQANAVGFWRISFEIKQPPPPSAGTASDQRTTRVKVGLHEPILANITNSTVSGVEPSPQVAYVDRAFTEYVMPERSSLQNRKDLRKMNYNLQNDSQVVAVVENLQFLW